MLLLTVFLLGGVSTGWAADKQVIEPKAQRILRAGLEYLQKAPEVSFRASVSEDHFLPSGQMIQFTRDITMHMRRPDKIRSEIVGNDGNVTSAYYDGKKFTLFNEIGNSYAEWDAPSNIDDFGEKIREKLGFSPPLVILLYEDLLKNLLKKVSSGFYVGKVPVDGVLCHHLAFTQENVDWQVWFQEGKQLTIRKLVVTLKKQPNAPRLTVVFADWDFKPGLADSLFAFDPPEGSLKIEFLPAGKK
jgi:hypothetical protein